MLVTKEVKIAPLEDVVVFPDLPYEAMPFSLESIGTSYTDRNYRMERCCSDVTVLEYVVKGSGFIETEEGTVHVKAGDSYLLRAFTPHKYYSNPEDPWEKVWINMRGTMILPLLNAYGITQHLFLYGTDLSAFIKRVHEVARNKSMDDYKIMDRSFVIFLELCQHIANLNSGNAHAHIPENIVLLKEYMDNHLSEHLALEELCRISYLSVSQTIRKFRAAYGVTPYEYLNQRRISTAKLLLTSSNLSIEEIALQTGFPDRNYFSKYFKKKVGKSPGQFRKSN